LGDETAGEGSLKNRLAQSGGTGELQIDIRIHSINHLHPPVNLVLNRLLNSQRRERN
jgi:hypothetical protein